MLHAKGSWALLGALFFSAFSAHAAAQEEPSDLQIHGFVSQGFIKTTSNNYLGPTARAQGSFDFTEVGINFTKPLSDKLRVGIQIFAHDLGPQGNYVPQLDWYYLDYRFFDWLGLRAGKTKLPWGLYNEANDVDAGRVPILLPQSVYPVANRESLFAQTGAELYGDVPLGSGGGSLEYRAYGGTIFLNTADASEKLKGFEVPYELGGRLMWHTPLPGLQVGGSAQAVRFNLSYAPTADEAMAYQAAGLLPADYNGTISIKFPIQLLVASAEYQMERLSVAAEFGRDYASYKTTLLSPEVKATSTAYYLMAAYQVKPWFTPGLYFSTLLPNTQMPVHKRSTYQRDLAATLRFDITPNWLVKLEGHYMHGTGGLRADLNDNKPLDSLDKNWGVFLVKTTCYF